MGSELELPLQKQPWSSSLRRDGFAAGVGPGPLGHGVSQLVSGCPEQPVSHLHRGGLHPLLCRARGGAAKEKTQRRDVQAGPWLRSHERLPSPNPWSMSTWSCGLQSQRQLRVTIAITLPLCHWLQKLARFPQPSGPARLWRASDFHTHPPPLFKGETSAGWGGEMSQTLTCHSQHRAALSITTAATRSVPRL